MLAWVKVPQWLSHQVAWWVCVLGTGWIRPGAMAAFVAIHLWFTRSAWQREVQIICWAVGLGFSADSCLVMVGAVDFEGVLRLGVVPLWMMSLWAGFGATLHHSQRALLKNRQVALIVGALGGPAAYWGGERLGCLTIDEPLGLIAVGCAWAVVLVSLEYCLRRHEAAETRLL